MDSFGENLGQKQEAVLVLRLQIGMQMEMSIWLYLRVKAGLCNWMHERTHNPPGMQPAT